jgi:hypothetical protein
MVSSIADVYKTILGREADQGGLDYWTGQLNSGMSIDEIKARMMDSQEYKAKTTQAPTYSAPQTATTSSPTQNYSQQITQYYQDALGRMPDKGGLDYWTGRMSSGMSGDDILASLRASDEAKAMPYTGQVSDYYRNILGRDPDQGGLDYWSGQLANGMSPDAVQQGLMSSQEFLGNLYPAQAQDGGYATNTPSFVINMPGQGEPTSGSEAQEQAMGGALNVAHQQANASYNYPSFYGNNFAAPQKMDYAAYANPGQMQSSQALSGGDYDALQNGLMAPIRQQWNDDQQTIKNMYGANGLYGSLGGGVMSGALADASSQRDLATGQATANRYALQMKDLERMDNNYLNQWKTNYANAGMQNDFNVSKTAWDYGQNEALRNYSNQNATNKYNYDIDRLNWQQGMKDNLFNKYSTLSGMGNAANQQNLAAKAASDASNANMWAGIGTGLGTFLGSGTGQGLMSGLWDNQGFELFSPSTWF